MTDASYIPQDSCSQHAYKVKTEDEPNHTRYIKTCIYCGKQQIFKTPKPVALFPFPS